MPLSNWKSIFSRLWEHSADVRALNSFFHSWESRGGKLISLGLSFIARWTVMAHFPACFPDGNAIFPDGEIIFVFYFDASFHVQVNKSSNVIFAAIKIIRHCMMGRIQDPLADMKIRKESSHSELGFQKSMRIMFWSRIQQRENRKVAFRVGGDKHI